MAISVTTAASKTGSTKVLEAIIAIAESSPDITPRTLKTLQALAAQGKIAAAFDDATIVGWIIAEPLGAHIEELGMAYILPAYRKKHIFKKLIALLINDRATQVFATYTPEIFTYMKETHGFSASSLSGVTVATNGRFLTKRLSPKVIKSIGGRLKSKPAYYAIRKATK